MLQDALQKIGMKSTEAKVYLACLKLGTQDVRTIAKEVGLSQHNTMMILTHLLESGFVSRFSSKRDFFTAERPQVILKILENKKFTMEESISLFTTILPQLEEFIDPEYTKPEIAFYEGHDGVIAAYEDTLTSKTDILAVASIDDTESRLPEYVPMYYKRRKAAGILIKAIFPDTAMARARQKKDHDELRISRLVPHELMQFHIELNIYDDKVAYFSIEEKLAIIVKSNVIANSMRNVFEMCWKMAEIYEQLPVKRDSRARGAARKKKQRRG